MVHGDQELKWRRDEN